MISILLFKRIAIPGICVEWVLVCPSISRPWKTRSSCRIRTNLYKVRCTRCSNLPHRNWSLPKSISLLTLWGRYLNSLVFWQHLWSSLYANIRDLGNNIGALYQFWHYDQYAGKLDRQATDETEPGANFAFVTPPSESIEVVFLHRYNLYGHIAPSFFQGCYQQLCRNTYDHEK